jgi:hypothetical protein
MMKKLAATERMLSEKNRNLVLTLVSVSASRRARFLDALQQALRDYIEARRQANVEHDDEKKVGAAQKKYMWVRNWAARALDKLNSVDAYSESEPLPYPLSFAQELRDVLNETRDLAEQAQLSCQSHGRPINIDCRLFVAKVLAAYYFATEHVPPLSRQAAAFKLVSTCLLLAGHVVEDAFYHYKFTLQHVDLRSFDMYQKLG